jgi:hypothetical protein
MIYLNDRLFVFLSQFDFLNECNAVLSSTNDFGNFVSVSS